MFLVLHFQGHEDMDPEEDEGDLNAFQLKRRWEEKYVILFIQ